MGHAQRTSRREPGPKWVITETSVQGDNETHTWVFMNPASQFWQQNLVQVVSTLAAHDVDIVQLDNWSIGAKKMKELW
jgi:hypothetical protein